MLHEPIQQFDAGLQTAPAPAAATCPGGLPLTEIDLSRDDLTPEGFEAVAHNGQTWFRQSDGLDPIFAVIRRHADAWNAFQVAPEGQPSEAANLAMHDALDHLLAASCRTRSGAIVLRAHLAWWLEEETEFAVDYEPHYGRATARVAEITALLRPKALSATAPPDPALAAIKRAREAEQAFTLALKNNDQDWPDEQIEAIGVVSSEALEALRRIVPTTLAGLFAVIRYYAEEANYACSQENGAAHLAALVCAIDGFALGAHASLHAAE